MLPQALFVLVFHLELEPQPPVFLILLLSSSTRAAKRVAGCMVSLDVCWVNQLPSPSREVLLLYHVSEVVALGCELKTVAGLKDKKKEASNKQ
jgi:hypothetical protein